MMRLLDNTLRDGEQTPGVAFRRDHKLRIAELLAAAGVTDAEVGFPAVSDEERRTIACIVKRSLPLRLHALCRLSKRDVDFALDCGVKNLTIFVPTGEQSRQALFGSAHLSDACETIHETVSYAVSNGASVKFSCEHSSQHWRADPCSLFRAYSVAWHAGACTISLPDTAGVLLPEEVPLLLAEAKATVDCDISVHFHNDLGLATANTILAAGAGATELQVCVNGLGERAGNAALEEVAFLACKRYGYLPDLDFVALNTLSGYVYEVAGLRPPFNKPFWGANAFAHESGIHVAAIEAGQDHLYSAFPASLVGRKLEVRLGKHSGLANIRMFARANGLNASEHSLKQGLALVKGLAEGRGGVSMAELERRLLETLQIRSVEA